jgi:hypothetical protein
MKRTGPLVIALISCGVAVLAALKLIDRVRVVDIITLFATGFAAGAGLVSGLMRLRRRRGAP